jgi:Altronate dehydratase
MTVPHIYVVNTNDNVATALEDLEGGPTTTIGAIADRELVLLQPLPSGHKAALKDIAKGETITKYGAGIGLASRDIRQGEWVHVHNLRSLFDERSSKIDAATGKAMDTRYD